jgi:Protein of unknown function (DUF2752)
VPIVTWTTRDKVLLLSPLAAIGALALAPLVEEGPTICPFALCTGMACPGCGMTRAAARLVRGDFASAVSLHPLIPLIAMLGVGSWVWFALRRAGWAPPMSNRLLNGILTATSLALIAVWVLRLATGTLPDV